MPRKRRSAAKGEDRSSETTPKLEKVSGVGSYLKNLSPAVREDFAEAVDLPTFLATAGELSLIQRIDIVKQALVLLEQNYVHLPLKRAMHAVDPVQRLRLLQRRLEQPTVQEQLSESEFHRELTDIFTSVRDLHTNYLLPSPFNRMTAFLPFMVEEFYEQGRRKYVVSRVAPSFDHPTFIPGVELVYWNGVPIERAVSNNSQRCAGSNAAARHARGVQTLTTRALIVSPPPDEEWIIVGYRTAASELNEIRIEWIVNPSPTAGSEASAEVSELTSAASMGIDIEQEIVQRVRKVLFAPEVVEAEQMAAAKADRGEEFADLVSSFPNVLQARPVTTPHGEFGYLRIRTFNVGSVTGFVDEFMRLLSLLTQNGLIIDVRGNGGGVIMNGELILQTLTPRRIEPEPLQFVNTPLNLEICRINGPISPIVDLSAWVESMQQSLHTASMFSSGFPISDPEACNSIGQKYFGPVVLVTDALCYSTTDFFVAGFQDHEIGPVLGVDDNTGAGGANVWTHELLQALVPSTESPYQPLPNQAGLRVAMRRSLRVGRRTGFPVEDLGVVPNERHFMTRQDLLNGNVDLINKAASLLANMPSRRLTVVVDAASPTQATITATTQGITRLDVYVEDRPIHSLYLRGGEVTFPVDKQDSTQVTLEVRGFDGSLLVARFRTKL